jgi:hypothetical protein
MLEYLVYATNPTNQLYILNFMNQLQALTAHIGPRIEVSGSSGSD